jgi:prepilin peptidase CpaA
MSELMFAATGPTLVAASCLLLLLAGASDLAIRRVPNWLSACLAAIGVALRIPAGDLPAGLGCGFAVFVLGALCWRRGWLGGGDVKLMAAAALLVAPYRVPGLILAVALAGGALAIAYLSLRAMLNTWRAVAPVQEKPRQQAERKNRLVRLMRIEFRRIRRGAPLPYASAICAGAIFVLLTR